MLTVVALLSGPHRLAMLEQALDSVPLDSPRVRALHIMHQGGPWDWGGALRERYEAHPKVRIVEFDDKADFSRSYNRTLDTVETRWALLLPDDDWLIGARLDVALAEIAATPGAEDVGFVAGGWYYLKDGRYLSSHVKRMDLEAVLRYAPKFATTLLNLPRVRELGGFARRAGGFCDTMLFGQLAYEYDALLSRTPIGVYRLHSGQESGKRQAIYAPFADVLRTELGRYARSPAELSTFERRMALFIADRATPLQQLSESLNFLTRSRTAPDMTAQPFGMRKWSAG